MFMKSKFNLSGILKTCLVLTFTVSIYAFGYYSNNSANYFQDNTLTAKQAKVLVDNYQAKAPVVDGKIEAFFVSKKLLEDINALASIKKSADGVRVYFGEDAEGKTANLVVAVNNNSDDTSFILKSAGTVNPCPTSCDKESAIRSE